LHHYHDSNLGYPDDPEPEATKWWLEDVHVTIDDSAVDLVEHGHPEEGLENECVDVNFLLFPGVKGDQVVWLANHKTTEVDEDH